MDLYLKGIISMDKIAKSYVSMLLSEMAKSIGPSSHSRIESYPKFKQMTYESAKDLPVHKVVNSKIKVHIDSSPGKEKFYTIDHNNKELLHMAFLTHHEANDDFPFSHSEQTLVDRVKSTDKLPKGYATNFLYDNFLNSGTTLRSSEDQYPNGHKMWKNLVDKAISDGFYAFHYNSITKKLTPLNDINKETMFKDSFGNSDDFLHKHLIISKNDIRNKENIISESKETRIPFADISHHHHRKHLNEGKIEDWINHKQPYGQQVNNFNFDTSIDSIRPKTYAAEDTHKDLADDHLSNLDGHHREAVESYIMGGLEDGDETGSFRVNDHLIKSHRAKKEPKKEFHFGSDEDFQRYLNLDHLDEALEINKLDKPMTTYSGIGFNPKDIMKEGNLLHLPAYTSSSTNRGVAVLYSKPDKDRVYHVIQIHHPTGSTGLYIGDRDDFSPFMQKEHIMPRNTTLKINPKPEVHTDNLGVQMYIWKATRVLDKDTK